MELDQTVMDEAWKLYMSEGRKGMNQIAKAIAKKHSVPQGDVHEYLISQVNSKRRRARWTVAGTIGAVITGMLLSYFTNEKAKPGLELAEKPVPVQSVGNSVPAKETKEPEEKRISVDDAVKMNGVQKLLCRSNSNYPHTIVVLKSHPLQFGGFIPIEEENTIESEIEIGKDFHRLGGRAISLEGLDDRCGREYSRTGRISASGNHNERMVAYFDRYNEILGIGKWHLYIGETQKNLNARAMELKPIIQVHNWFRESAIDETEKLLNSLAVGSNGEVKLPDNYHEIMSEKMSEFIGRLDVQAQAKIDGVLTPEKMARIYWLAISDRNCDYADMAVRAKNTGDTPIMIKIGADHIYGLREEFESRGIEYAFLAPKGLDISSMQESSPEEFATTLRALPTAKSLLEFKARVTEEGFKVIRK